MGKRLSDARLALLEDRINGAVTGKSSAVFGICNMDKVVIKKIMVSANGVVETDDEPTILIPERLEKLLYPKRTKIVFGGRGSAKTRTVVSILTEFARFTTERVACFREIMASIKDSSHQEIADEVERKGLSDEFQVLEREIKVPFTKSRFSFGGLYRNITNVKGFAGATKSWIDEAENVSKDSLDILEPTLRGKGSELWYTFNPKEESDPMWATMVAPYWDKAVDGIYEDDDTLIIECNHSHNPWLTHELIITRDKMKRVDYDRYLWIWEGKFRQNSDVKVFNKKWRVAEFTPDKSWGDPMYGADFGFSQDPSTIVRVWVKDDRLYVEYDASDVGVEINDMFHFYAGDDGATDKQRRYLRERASDGKKVYKGIPEARKYLIRADCARPETISHIKAEGFKIVGCEKWSGSIEDGIAHMKGYEEIIIHPRCTATISDFAQYSFKVNRLTGDILTDIVDAHNNCIDPIRYAIGPLIKRKKQFKVFV